ncbi:hypothetical protein BGZ94_009244 [Podila epigama]|nr:hypothetical protein BGZ94_009244 [Podila epigama]
MKLAGSNATASQADDSSINRQETATSKSTGLHFTRTGQEGRTTLGSMFPAFSAPSCGVLGLGSPTRCTTNTKSISHSDKKINETPTARVTTSSVHTSADGNHSVHGQQLSVGHWKNSDADTKELHTIKAAHIHSQSPPEMVNSIPRPILNSLAIGPRLPCLNAYQEGEKTGPIQLDNSNHIESTDAHETSKDGNGRSVHLKAEIQIMDSPSSLVGQCHDQHEFGNRMDTPLLDLQEQGYAIELIAGEKIRSSRAFEERLAVMTKSLSEETKGGDAMDKNEEADKVELRSSALDARYLECSLPIRGQTPSPCEWQRPEQCLLDELCDMEKLYVEWLLDWSSCTQFNTEGQLQSGQSEETVSAPRGSRRTRRVRFSRKIRRIQYVIDEEEEEEEEEEERKSDMLGDDAEDKNDEKDVVAQTILKPQVCRTTSISLHLDTHLLQKRSISDSKSYLLSPRMQEYLRDPCRTGGVSNDEINKTTQSISILSPVSPRTLELATTRRQLMYWTQEATVLRQQERLLTKRFDALVAEMSDLIERCHLSESTLYEATMQVQELQHKLVQEQNLGFSFVQEVALSMRENEMLEIALEETWKEIDIMQGALLPRTKSIGAQKEELQHQLAPMFLVTKTKPLMASSPASPDEWLDQWDNLGVAVMTIAQEIVISWQTMVEHKQELWYLLTAPKVRYNLL